LHWKGATLRFKQLISIISYLNDNLKIFLIFLKKRRTFEIKNVFRHVKIIWRTKKGGNIIYYATRG